MIKLICKECGEEWYTANTRSNQKCGSCGGILVEEDFIPSKDIESDEHNDTKSKNECKVIYLN
ncbi:hypothetical protein HMPREF1982_01959 [Clostridiales bacterium oral taxon 876 str. F0540]|nr:hypothetical protein HMPREF1982_01959 [Clostridiales bacterium oral taxon 876 str. F0540]